MKGIFFSFCLLSFSAFSQVKNVEKVVESMHWLGQASYKIVNKKIIYIDPFELKKADKADIIFITHSHFDHLDKDSLAKILTPNTYVFGPQLVADELKDRKIQVVKPGDKIKVEGIEVEVVPAYNVVKTKFHPKEKGFVGYILNIDGVRIYHSGDTERIPEMKNFNVDIALLPMGQTYTMSGPLEASEAALDTKAKIAIPMHYGKAEGKEADALKFQELLKGKIKVIIKKREE